MVSVRVVRNRVRVTVRVLSGLQLGGIEVRARPGRILGTTLRNGLNTVNRVGRKMLLTHGLLQRDYTRWPKKEAVIKDHH